MAISDFGCAFNAYRREAVEPVLGAIGKQKFTKALVLSTGASVVEVDVGHAARADKSRYSPLRLVRTALSVLAGFWPQPIQWIGLALGVICTLFAVALGIWGVIFWIDHSNFPGPLFGGVAVLFVLGVQGFILALVGEYLGRIQRDVSGRPLYTIDREAMTKRVLVTGGAGFISSTFVRHLLEATPYEVVSLDALTYAGNLENLADVMAHERLSFVHGDIRDRELVRQLVSEVDVIVNAAAESHVEKSIEEGASEFVTTNVEGTQILLDAVRETPVERFILISSSEVYGTAEADPMDEEHPLNPRSPYAATKAGADRLAYSYWTTYELPIVIVRPFNNYGPRQHPEKVIPRFITQALSDEPLTIHGDGHASRDWLYVDRRCRGDRGGDRGRHRLDRRRGDQRRHRRRHLGLGHRRRGARRARQARLAEEQRARAPGPGRPSHRLHGQGRTAARLPRPHLFRGGPGAHRRVVSRQ